LLRQVLLHYLLQTVQRFQPLLLRQLLLHGLLLPQHEHELLLRVALLRAAVLRQPVLPAGMRS
jgi:hypothetical protein